MPPQSGATDGSPAARQEQDIHLPSSLEQFVVHECIVPDCIPILVEIPIKHLAYLVAVDVTSADQFDQRVRFIQRQSRNPAIRSATTVAVKRDPHQVYPPI